jgi:hypothetical protein
MVGGVIIVPSRDGVGPFAPWTWDNVSMPNDRESPPMESRNLLRRLYVFDAIQGPSVALIRHVDLDLVSHLEGASWPAVSCTV